MAMVVYELPLEEEDGPPLIQHEEDAPLPLGQLIRNLKWFVCLRALVSFVFVVSGFVYLPTGSFFRQQGISVPYLWPIWLGIILCLANIGFFLHSRKAAASQSTKAVRVALWTQIVFDLIVLSVAVHFLGSVSSFASFACLFHIVLACILFPRKESFCVVLLASVLFAGCVVAERTGLVEPSSLFGDAVRAMDPTSPLLALTMHIASGIAVWLTVWYMASRVARTTRLRDLQLAETNQRLIRAGTERVRHMLHTTHEIKAPFAAIHANTQVLLKGYCGELPEKAVDIVERIERRCRRLSDEIKQMVQLANLQSKGQSDPPTETIDLKECLEQCLAQAEDLAMEHDVLLETELESVSVQGIRDHIHMMFENLISNAISYSHCDETVRICCRSTQDYAAEVSVQDQGIGIPEEKVSRIFEDYYRTQEAVSHNKSSTGLGLAVVRRIALKHNLRVVVKTELERGTTFIVSFPIEHGQ